MIMLLLFRSSARQLSSEALSRRLMGESTAHVVRVLASQALTRVYVVESVCDMVLGFEVRLLCSFFTFRPVKSGPVSSPPLGRCPYSGNVEPWLPSVNQGSRRLPDWTIRPPLRPPPQEHSRSPTYTSTCLYASGEDLDLQRLKDDSASFPLTSQLALTPIPPPPK
jgi:hypothetical protein